MYIYISTDACIELADTLHLRRRTSRLALLLRYWENTSVYGPTGVRYSVVPMNTAPRSRPLWRFLTVVYNPVREVTLTYDEVGAYSLDDLKRDITRCVNKDVDILISFHEAEEIRERLGNAKTFDEVVGVIRWMTEETTGQIVRGT